MRNIGFVLGVLFVLLLVLIGPLAIIWAWNVLFGSVLTIAYTIETWLAAMVFGMFFRPNIQTSKKD